MNSIDITLYLNEYRVRALADALGSQTAETVEDKLTEAFDTLYQEYVPDEQRASIEARIEREDAAEQARLEAARRFAVYHIRENSEDCHFTSDYFHTPMQAAYRYRLYERGELSADPKTFADAFIETNPVSLEYFGKVCADIHADDRVTALLEFDLDEGCVSICDSDDNEWQTYEELREIVQDPTAYESWHTALSTVNAVYLIVDRENGRKYVGSAYGKGGLLGRWTHYVKSLHGDNKLMKELLCDYPDRYTHFQFSILQLLPKVVTPDEAIQTETLWKKKLLTYEPLGMNAN